MSSKEYAAAQKTGYETTLFRNDQGTNRPAPHGPICVQFFRGERWFFVLLILVKLLTVIDWYNFLFIIGAWEQ